MSLAPGRALGINKNQPPGSSPLLTLPGQDLGGGLGDEHLDSYRGKELASAI